MHKSKFCFAALAERKPRFLHASKAARQKSGYNGKGHCRCTTRFSTPPGQERLPVAEVQSLPAGAALKRSCIAESAAPYCA